MVIKKLLLFAVFVAIGFTAYSQRATIRGSLGTLPDVPWLIADKLQPTITRIQSTWTNIPEPYKGYANLAAVGGIPTALMMFFAWTKNRAMQKVQQTQQLASEQIGSLNTQMQTVEEERDTKIGELEAQLKTAQNSTGLQTSLTEATNLVKQKQEEIKLLTARYQGQIDALHKQITDQKLKVHETTVIG